ncbi:MAG: hypothetical protein JNM72_18865 [Deltaproteobacteria bacterium]|nr:hypothetical protein [Deltaproteobacteria bacterium]
MRVVSITDHGDSETMLAELIEDQVELPEYAGAYTVFRAATRGRLCALLDRADLVHMHVRSDLRAALPGFGQLSSRVSSGAESQPPHMDHPHRPGDQRRYNLFWAEHPREGATTYFLPLGLGPEVADLLEQHLHRNERAWAWSEPLVAAWKRDPRSLSRYLVPPEAIVAYADLVRYGRKAAWRRLSVDGRLMVTTRIMSNNSEATRMVEWLLCRLQQTHPGEVCSVAYTAPTVVIADDTALYHGRLGRGETGAGFFRRWLLAHGSARRFAWTGGEAADHEVAHEVNPNVVAPRG